MNRRSLRGLGVCLAVIGGVYVTGCSVGIGGFRVGGGSGIGVGAGVQVPIGTRQTSSGVPKISAAIRAAVDAPDRSEADRALDAGRHPAELLAFCGIKPGMRVAEIGAGSGYTTELLARVVGSNGAVIGQNDPFVLDRFAQQPWTERLTKPVMNNVVRSDRTFDDPFPPDVGGLDAVVIVLFYHDVFWISGSPAAMNAKVLEALKVGGTYCIIDHSAAEGTGSAHVKTLHRVDEELVRKQVREAGFQVDGEGTFLRNPADSRDWNASPRAAGERRGSSDRFALRFRRPSRNPFRR